MRNNNNDKLETEKDNKLALLKAEVRKRYGNAAASDLRD